MTGYYQSMDFCGDLQNWTSAILADDKGPNVHSVSYGFQGNLSQHMTQTRTNPCSSISEVNDIDNSLAKIAAVGVSPCESNVPRRWDLPCERVSNRHWEWVVKRGERPLRGCKIVADTPMDF